MAPSLSRGTPVVYFLRLTSGVIYVGTSTDLEQRILDHYCGRACRTTHVDRPRAILRVEIHDTFAAARAREAQVKRWSRAKKEALVSGDLDRLIHLSKSRMQNRQA